MGRLAVLGLCIALAAACLPSTSLAHGGGLDAAGCHHVKKTGEYHCHRAPLPGAVVKEKRERGGAKDVPAVVSPAPAAGTYLEKCKAITDPAERLKCFDAAAK